MSNSLQPFGPQPARFLCPWDSPGKNIEVNCHDPSRGSSRPRDWTSIPYVLSPALTGGFFTTSATWEVPSSIASLLIWAITFSKLWSHSFFFFLSLTALQLWHVGSLLHHANFCCSAQTLVVVCGLSSCGTWATKACGFLITRPGIEPTSPALQGRFSTTGPPVKSLKSHSNYSQLQ